MIDPIEAATILRGANVVTMDPGRPRAEAIALRDGRIAAVGTEAEVARYASPASEAIDLDGLTVVPGFIDVHTHVANNTPHPLDVDLRDFYDPTITSVGVLLERLRAAAADVPADEWVVGVTSPTLDARVEEGRLPTREELDAALGGRAGYLVVGPHLTLASTRALEAAGITRDGPADAGGAIEREADGMPTGLLREAAQQLVKRRRPRSDRPLADRLLVELQRCAGRGVTEIHDVVIHPDEVLAYQDLAATERLPVRVQLLVRVFQSAFDPLALLNLGLRTGFGSELIRIGGAKMSVDGGFDQAVFRPLDDDRSRLHPVQRMTEREVHELVDAYHRTGSRLCIHAAGDAALDTALGALEATLAEDPRPDHRHRIEHMGNWAMTEQHLERAKALGVTPVPNASELYYMGREARRILDERRLVNPFAFRSIAAAGIPLVMASDGGGLWPVDPLRDIAVASRGEGRDGLGDEVVTPTVALAAFTSAAAWLGFEEREAGVIRAGYRADLAILDGDPTDEAATAGGRIDVVATLMAGRVTYSTHPRLTAEAETSAGTQ